MFRTGARIDSTTLTRRNPVGNDLVTDKEDLLRIWASYFTELSQSKIDESEDLQLLSNKVESLYEASLANEEHLLDTPFTVEELEQTLGKLKMRKTSGPDGLCAEHLKLGGFVHMAAENPQQHH